MIHKIIKIKTKLSLLLLLSSLTATFLACSFLLVFWIYLSLQTLQDDLETTANTLGENSKAAILFNLPSEAKTIMAALKSKPTIAYAEIAYGDSRESAAYYSREANGEETVSIPLGPYPVHQLSWDKAVVVTEILLDGERVGLFYLQDDLSGLKKSMYALFLIIPPVLITVLFLSYVLLLKVQKRITDPILALSATARAITTGNDYSIRAQKENPDEIGELTDAFNTMLAEVDSHRTRLEELVDERTTELKETQNQLLVQERLAVLGKLTATVSHELRNPMGTISNALYNLRAGLAANKMEMVDNALTVSERNIKRCDRIISELLDYSKKRVLGRELINVDDFLVDLVAEINWPEEIDLVQDYQSGAILSADSDRLRRAVLNIIINAQQALQESAQGEKRISISTRVNTENVEIIIEDNGPGIPEEFGEKIFEPLFSTKNFGVGLGMPIVKDIMEMHHGGIRLEKNIGAGCRFVLWMLVSGENQLKE